MSDFSLLLDKVFEGGVKIVDKVFDTKISENEAQTQVNARAVEEARLAQLQIAQQYGIANDLGTITAFGYSFPSWTVPAGLLAVTGLFLLARKK